MDQKQLLESLELIVAWLAKIPARPVLALISLAGLGVGIFLILKPALAIEIQKRFYAQINWKIEPISLTKEIRNTRLMGWILIILCIITLAFLRSKNPILT